MTEETFSALQPELILWGTAGVLLALRGLTGRAAVRWTAFGGLVAAGYFLQSHAPTSPSSPIHIDSFALTGRWTCLFLGLLLALFEGGADSSQESGLRLAGLVGTTAAGMSMCAANDLVFAYVALEVTFLGAMWCAAATSNNQKAAASTIKFYRFHLVAAVLILCGFIPLYGLSGSTNLNSIRGIFLSSYAAADESWIVGGGSRLGVVALTFVFGGIGIRIAAAPFHLGWGEVFDGVSGWSAAVISTLLRVAGLFLLIRVTVNAMPGFEVWGQILCIVMAGMSMTVGNMRALVRTNFREILSSLAAAQVGYILLGAAVGFSDSTAAGTGRWQGLPTGTHSAVMICCSSLIAVCGLYAFWIQITPAESAVPILSPMKRMAGPLESRTPPLEYLEDLHGCYRRQPWATVCACILLCTLAGFPFTPGYWGRVWLLIAAAGVPMGSGGGSYAIPNTGFLVMIVVAVLNWVMTMAACLRLMAAMLFEQPRIPSQAAPRRDARAAVGLSAVVILVSGMFPWLLFHRLEKIDIPQRSAPAFRDALEPSAYRAAVRAQDSRNGLTQSHALERPHATADHKKMAAVPRQADLRQTHLEWTP